jgi:threonine/homoserine/homoserine lactone efflux protein
VATISPGPDTALVIAHAGRRGIRAGLLAACGVATGNLWYAALFGFGLMTLLAAQPTVYTIVKIAGAGYLAWIGFKMVRAALRGQPQLHASTAKGAPFLQGLFTNVLNPKIALFFLAAIPQFAGNGPNAPMIGVALIFISGLINLGWLSAVALSVGRAGARFRHSQFMRWLEGGIGLLLLGLAGRVAFDRNL